ncbi:MAG: metallophosphoesterase family protein [Alphaproteobacteria bacterium]
MTVFFTADTHFGHAGVIGLFRRPFASVAEMDATLLARWNERIRPDDEVWHLGDFAVGVPATGMQALLSALNGHKHLIAGNNDAEPTRTLRGWTSVAPYAEIAVDGTRLVLCHYPFRSWNGMHRGVVDLHGHSHGRLKGLPRQIDVGVDCWNFAPVTLAEIRPPGLR